MRKVFHSKKVITVLLVGAAIMIEIIVGILFFVPDKGKSNLLEMLYYSSQCITSVFVISGVVIAVWEYHLSYKNTKTTLEITQVQKAVDLAAYFKDHIIRLSQPILYVYKQAGISKLLDTVDKNKMTDFDVNEMKRLLTVEKINTFRCIVTKDEFMRAVIEANFAYSLQLPLENAVINKEERRVSYNRGKVAEAFMNHIVLELMNNMEFFAMHFTHNTADDSVVFQSLHQTYIDICQSLYYNISHDNNYDQAKYYTNLIELYNRWKTEADITDSKINVAARTAVKYGTIVSGNIDN